MSDGRAPEPPHVSPRRRRVADRFAEVQRNHVALAGAMEAYPTPESFAEAWIEDEETVSVSIAAIERFYERIVTDLQEAFDFVEVELESRGELTRVEGIGRWQRLHEYGFIGKAQADDFRRLSDLRNEPFAHKYADLDRAKGEEVHDSIHELLRRTPDVVKALRDWSEQAWPEGFG